MKAMVLTAALIVAALPAMASNSGRIACQNEVRDVVQRIKLENIPLTRETAERIEVANSQCRFAPGLAEASLDGVRQSLGIRSVGPQAAYAPPADEQIDVYD